MKMRRTDGVTVYVECGVFYDQASRRIHVTVPGADRALDAPRSHWSVGPDHPQWEMFKRILQRAGRWPEEAQR